MLFRLKHHLHRRQHRERYRMLDELLHNQTLSRAQLMDKQQQDFASIVQHAYNNTSYYREKYAQFIGYHAQGAIADNPLSSNPSQPPLDWGGANSSLPLLEEGSQQSCGVPTSIPLAGARGGWEGFIV